VLLGDIYPLENTIAPLVSRDSSDMTTFGGGLKRAGFHARGRWLL
jgi:hypothetical protein